MRPDSLYHYEAEPAVAIYWSLFFLQLIFSDLQSTITPTNSSHHL